MGYSEDYAHAELDAQGAEFGRELSEHEIMCEHFGYTIEAFAELSNKDRQNFTWNWKTFKDKG